ncbi:MAG: hypothetical protein C0613_07480 [Desulfobulbaceae bacterium]|nr:MAG: hypothetical protein C0613_07480 [Desulfobulbaceae bacterium]
MLIFLGLYGIRAARNSLFWACFFGPTQKQGISEFRRLASLFEMTKQPACKSSSRIFGVSQARRYREIWAHFT